MSVQASPRGLLSWAVLCMLAAAPALALALIAVNLLQAAEFGALAERQNETVTQLERRVAAIAGRTAPAVDASAIYLAGATPALARAALQRRLVDAVERATGRVIEAEEASIDGSEAQSAGEVRLRITFDANNAAVLDLLHGLETGLPLLTVERIEIRRLDTGGEDPMLRVALIVVGATRLVTG